MSGQTAAGDAAPVAALNAMIRVAFLDGHPAVRAGLQAILAPEHDLQLVGFATDEHELWPLLQRRPAIVVLDLHHPGRDGLALCLQIKLQPDAAARLDPADHAILAMRVAGDSPVEIAATLGVPDTAIADRIAEIVAKLEPLRSAA